LVHVERRHVDRRPGRAAVERCEAPACHAMERDLALCALCARSRRRTEHDAEREDRGAAHGCPTGGAGSCARTAATISSVTSSPSLPKCERTYVSTFATS